MMDLNRMKIHMTYSTCITKKMEGWDRLILSHIPPPLLAPNLLQPHPTARDWLPPSPPPNLSYRHLAARVVLALLTPNLPHHRLAARGAWPLLATKSSAPSSISHIQLAISLHSDSAAAPHHELDSVESSGQLVRNDNTDGNSSDDESGAGEDAIPSWAKRNTKKSHRDPYSHHLGFYLGTWYDVLMEAKNRYWLFIHTQNPFPERNRDGLCDAYDCLLETVSKYKDDGIQLDKGNIKN